jgi:hypothetical protein
VHDFLVYTILQQLQQQQEQPQAHSFLAHLASSQQQQQQPSPLPQQQQESRALSSNAELLTSFLTLLTPQLTQNQQNPPNPLQTHPPPPHHQGTLPRREGFGQIEPRSNHVDQCVQNYIDIQALRLLNAHRSPEQQQEIQQLQPHPPPPPPQSQTTITAPQLLLAQVFEQFLRTPGRAEPTNSLGAPVDPISSSSSRHEQATSQPPKNIHQEGNEVDQRHQLLIEPQEECKVAVAVAPPYQQQTQQEEKNLHSEDERVIIAEEEESSKYSTEDPTNKQDSNSNSTTTARLDSHIGSLFDMGLGSYFKANPTEEDDFVRIACKARRGMGADHNFKVCTFLSHILSR